VFDYENGKLNSKQSISTLPIDYRGENSCADIHISPDGKFLYGSNRIHDSIVIYSINPETGLLTYIGNESTQGKKPRNFMIDPTGKFLLVGNMETDNIVIFKRNSKTGRLKATGKEIKMPMPVCLRVD
jgi:6-phosphogluconolactonase